ncbi:hypothetical protein U1Q18_049732, partial [Sarracenia purpurea var. burkii]
FGLIYLDRTNTFKSGRAKHGDDSESATTPTVQGDYDGLGIRGYRWRYMARGSTQGRQCDGCAMAGLCDGPVR